MLKNLIGKLNLGRHQWSESEIEKYLGTFSNIYSSYSRDEKFGKFATSGGSVTAMLDFAIKSRLIAAAQIGRAHV